MTGRETRSFRSHDGTRLAYHVVGSGPPLLCLPGGPGRASSYLRDLGGLAATRTLVQLDTRGTGMSPFPDDPASMAFDRLADDVEALRDALGLDRVSVLGHSAGAMVAQVYAARWPDRLAGLVLVTPSGALHGAGYGDVPAIHASRAGEDWYDDAVAAREQLAGDPIEGRRELERRVRPLYYGRWDEEVAAHAHAAEREMSPRAERAFRRSSADVEAVRAALATVTVATLVVAGERDGITGVESAHTVAAAMPGARTVVLPRAGHFPWVDEPDAFRAAVSGFLTRLGV